MERLQQHWYRYSLLHLMLVPISLIFRILSALRRFLYGSGILKSVRLPVPVVIVGNISIGGTGKTPLTLWLAQQLITNGWHPGIVSRGYSRSAKALTVPRAVGVDDDADMIGDEPLLMAQRALCPVWVGRDRPAAALALLQQHPECDILLSDDGLQHYRLRRDAEIVVVDGARRFGNGLLLPAGPLREPVKRLRQVDAVVINGGQADAGEFAMSLHGSQFHNLLNPETVVSAAEFTDMNVHAIAGIGHPQRFFSHLQRLGLNPQCHTFPDHHRYSAGDISVAGADAILMTEKDAVKCASFASERCWVLRVDAQVDPALTQLILNKVTHDGR